MHLAPPVSGPPKGQWMLHDRLQPPCRGQAAVTRDFHKAHPGNVLSLPLHFYCFSPPTEFPWRIALLPARSPATCFIAPTYLGLSLAVPLTARALHCKPLQSSSYKQRKAAQAGVEIQRWLKSEAASVCGTVHAEHLRVPPLPARPREQVSSFPGRRGISCAHCAERSKASGELFRCDIQGPAWFSWKRSPVFYVFWHYFVHTAFVSRGRLGF